MDAMALLAIIMLVIMLCSLIISVVDEIKSENNKKTESGFCDYNDEVDQKIILLIERFHLGELDVKVTNKHLVFLENNEIVAKVITDNLSSYPYASFRDRIYYGRVLKGKPSWKTQLSVMRFRKKLYSIAINQKNNIVSSRKTPEKVPEEVQL